MVAMSLSSLPEVRPEALATPPLVVVARAIERGEREMLVALGAPSLTAVISSFRSGWLDHLRDSGRRRDGNITDPEADRGLRDAELSDNAIQRPALGAKRSCL